MAYPRHAKRLPVVLSQEEVKRLFDAVRRPKYLALLMTAYAAGLRVSEVTQLQVSDLDSSRMVIRVRQGKVRKDRYVLGHRNVRTTEVNTHVSTGIVSAAVSPFEALAYQVDADPPLRMRPPLEVADIFRQCGNDFRLTPTLSPEHRRVMRAIERCRTAALGNSKSLNSPSS